MRLRTLLPLLGLMAAPSAVQAQSPIQLSLFPPLQLVNESEAVSGLRLGIYARNSAMTGLDVGFVTHTTGDASAFQWGLAHIVEGDFLGLQGGLVNMTQGTMQGFQYGFYNGAGAGEGFQWGFVNNTEGRMAGLQLSFVNVANDMNGIQVGLINIIRSKDRFPVLPIVNWKFDEAR